MNRMRNFLLGLLSFSILLAVLSFSILTPPVAEAGTQPDAPCNADTVGNLGYINYETGCGPAADLHLYDVFICEETSSGNFRWIFVDTMCGGGIFVPQF